MRPAASLRKKEEWKDRFEWTASDGERIVMISTFKPPT
ncbi:DUF2777 family protein [Bacillus licheniformis]|nr:DUF2777 family protein [Bacillus licheniformis]